MRVAFGDAVDLDAEPVVHGHPPSRPVTAIPPGLRNVRMSRPIAAMTMNTTTTTSTENAAAGPSESSVMFSRIFTVTSVQLTDTRKIVALIAVIDRMNTM